MSARGSLAVSSVDFGYRRNQRVLRAIDWQPGRRAALLGPNGAGKSTLFGVLCGVHRPDAGSVTVHGAALRRGVVAWMPQSIQAVPGLRSREQVALAGWMQGHSRARAWQASGPALEAVDLGGQADQKAKTLSGGQLRRLGVAEVLVADPSVVLLDEPTVGLDPLQRAEVRSLISSLGDRCQVIVATHLVEDLESAFDTVTVLVGGEIRFDGTVDEFVGQASSSGSFSDRATAAYAAVVSGAGGR